MLVAALVPAVIVLGSVFSTKALTSIISFATLGIYLGFHMVTLRGAAGPAEGLGAERQLHARTLGDARSTSRRWRTASSR